MTKRNTTPLLLCIPENKLAQVIEDLNDYNREVHNTGFSMPEYLEEKQVSYEYEGYAEDYDAELRKAPSRSRG